MAEAGGNPGGTRWVLQRPAPGKMELQVIVEEEARLSPEVRGAIENLIHALQPEDDVQGYRMKPDPDKHDRFSETWRGKR